MDGAAACAGRREVAVALLYSYIACVGMLYLTPCVSMLDLFHPDAPYVVCMQRVSPRC